MTTSYCRWCLLLKCNSGFAGNNHARTMRGKTKTSKTKPCANHARPILSIGPSVGPFWGHFGGFLLAPVCPHPCRQLGQNEPQSMREPCANHARTHQPGRWTKWALNGPFTGPLLGPLWPHNGPFMAPQWAPNRRRFTSLKSSM